MHEICFVTGNAGKLGEVSAILRDERVNVTSRNAERKLVLITEVAPTHKSEIYILRLVPELQGEIEDIVRGKCLSAYQILKNDIPKGAWVMVDDTSLCFDAWNGLPGPYIKSFVSRIPLANFRPMLEGGSRDTKAKAMASFALYNGEGDVHIFQGVCEGNIVSPRSKSAAGFGWDPIFEPVNYNLTFAEMDSDEKNKISHRRKALTSVLNFLISKEA